MNNDYVSVICLRLNIDDVDAVIAQLSKNEDTAKIAESLSKAKHSVLYDKFKLCRICEHTGNVFTLGTGTYDEMVKRLKITQDNNPDELYSIEKDEE